MKRNRMEIISEERKDENNDRWPYEHVSEKLNVYTYRLGIKSTFSLYRVYVDSKNTSASVWKLNV